jgi:hypothetical protein
LPLPVYVVLVNYNSCSDTIECLESLLRADYDNVHVIVVDNASADGSVEKLVAWAEGDEAPAPARSVALRQLSWPPVAKPVNCAQLDAEHVPNGFSFPAVTLISSKKNLGFAGGNNVALKTVMASTRDGYACLVNNDMVVAPNAISAMVRAIEQDATLAAVGGAILDYDAPNLVQSVGGGWMAKLWGTSKVFGSGAKLDEIRIPRELGYISGGWLLTRFEAIRSVGLLDESYFLYAEDADWGERMRKAGLRLGCAADAFTWHKGSQTIVARSPFQDYHIVRSALLFNRKHARQTSVLAWSYSILRFLLPKVLRGQWSRARAVMRAYANVMRSG